MIDPVHALSFSVQACRGVYAVLVGSGVSRAAKVPTGWEITLDLIGKLAELRGEACGPDPERWYQDRYGKEPDYSDLLGALAKTQAERQQLLRGYFEPTEQEREDGEKQPTEAHRAIAALAAKGFVRVILTTNFDRLIEDALAEQGVVPTVLSFPDQVEGTLPLIHTECCVLKLHGDYQDTRVRNTPGELDQYPSEFDRLLDRVFDEFGLVVCGWSADWDGALREALFRAPSRRFTTYWALQSQPGDQARRLIAHRRAEVVQIEDADSFFQTVREQIESLEEFSRPHPLSTEAAVASLKRYVSEPRYRVRLSDLVGETVEQAVRDTSGEAFPVDGLPLDSGSVTARVRAYEAACSTLAAMAVVGGFWAEEDRDQLWRRALERLSQAPLQAGEILWLGLQRYPATLLLYALGIGAVDAGRLRFLGHLFDTTITMEHREDTTAVQVLPPACLSSQFGSYSNDPMNLLDGMEKRSVPLNDWLHDALRPYATRVIPDDARYSLMFDKLETLIALSYVYRDGRLSSQEWQEWAWAPPGAFCYRNKNRDRVIREIEGSISTRRDESPFVASGIFGETAEACEQVLAALKKFISKLGWR